MQYLQLQLGFNTRDQAHLLMVVAALGLLIKLLLLPHLVRVLGEQWLLVLGLSSYMLQVRAAWLLCPAEGAGGVHEPLPALACSGGPEMVISEPRLPRLDSLWKVTQRVVPAE